MFPVEPIISNKEDNFKSNDSVFTPSKYENNVFIQLDNNKSWRRTRSFDPNSVENESKKTPASPTLINPTIEPLKDSSSTNYQKVPNKPVRKKMSTSSVLSTSLQSPINKVLVNYSTNDQNNLNCLTNQIINSPKQKQAPPLPPKPKHMAISNVPTPPKVTFLFFI